MEDCIFCKIIKGEIPSSKVYEDDQILAFKDIAPKAETHLLVIPKKHLKNFNELADEEETLLTAHMMQKIPYIARSAGLSDYRLVTNNGAGAGQVVFHLHFHILGGSSLPGF